MCLRGLEWQCQTCETLPREPAAGALQSWSIAILPGLRFITCSMAGLAGPGLVPLDIAEAKKGAVRDPAEPVYCYCQRGELWGDGGLRQRGLPHRVVPL